MSLVAKLEKENHSSHAYLLIGSNQTEIRQGIDYLIKSAGGLADDIVKIEESDDQSKSEEIKVDAVRHFLHHLCLSPYGPVRIGIIERCERLNPSSANILLKVLEEPPQNVILILTSTNEKILATIKSRCRIYKASGLIPRQLSGQAFSYANILSANLAEAFKSIEMIVKTDQAGDFLNEFLAETSSKMIQNIDPKMEELAENIMTAQRRIKANVNPRLVLENLIIKARQLMSL
ncbi:MAG TPA: hypothetical protein VJK08_01775 [Patescibacteria group bacterium]|nr:hypothetical protein [Patescibacteria group bacterium]